MTAAFLQATLTRLPRFGPAPRPAQAGRVCALDGLRGWAALSVVACHLWWETFGVVVPGYRNALTASLLDGPLAVSIFFVLSGAALSTPYFSGKGPRSVIDLGLKRYPRLVIPILAVSLLTALLLGLDLCSNGPAGQIVRRPEWLGSWLQSPLGLGQVLKFAFYDVFASSTPQREPIPFLWSMKIELIGSVLTFGLLLFCHGSRIGWLVFGAVFFALMAAYVWKVQTCGLLACFLAGIALSKARAAGLLARAHGSRLLDIGTMGIIVVLLAADGIMNARGLHPWRASAIAMPLVPAVSCNRYAETFLNNGVSRFLGRISFPLFLVQFPVIVSFTSWAIVQAGSDRIADAANVICVASLAVCVAAAVLFEPVELVTRKFGAWLVEGSRAWSATATTDTTDRAG